MQNVLESKKCKSSYNLCSLQALAILHSPYKSTVQEVLRWPPVYLNKRQHHTSKEGLEGDE